MTRRSYKAVTLVDSFSSSILSGGGFTLLSSNSATTVTGRLALSFSCDPLLLVRPLTSDFFNSEDPLCQLLLLRGGRFT